MKTIVNFIFCMLVVFASISANSQDVLVVFTDQSASVDCTPAVAQQAHIAALKFLDTHLGGTNATIYIAPIHDNTSDLSGVTRINYVPPVFSSTAKFSAERAYDKKWHANKVNQLKVTVMSEAIKTIKALPNQSQESAYYQSLNVMQTIESQHQGDNIRVLYIGDLIEDSSITNLENRLNDASISYQAAREMAIRDLSKASSLYGIPERFSRVKSIDIFMPNEGLSTQPIFRLLPVYWAEVFAQLGLPAPNFLQ